MEKRERVKPSSDPVMDKIFGNSTQDKTPVSKTAKPSSDPVMDAVFQKKNDGGNVSSTSSVPSDTSVSESTSQTPEPKQSLENSTPIKPTAFNSPVLSSDQLQALFDAPKQFNENPNPKKVSAGEFLAKDIETHAPNIFENVAKATGQAMPFADKMSEFDKQHIAKETKLNVMNNPADMSNYVATRVKALRGSISDLEKDKLAYTDFAGSGGTVIKDQAAYDKANEKIAQKQNYINDLKNNVAELASAKVLEKVDFKNFLPQDIGRQIVKISDPELDLQFQQAEKFGSLPGGRRAELEKIGIDAARNYLNKNPDIPNAKEAKAFLNDTESTFDIRNSEATAARVRSKLGQYFYNEGGVQDKSGVFGYSEKNLRDALNDPKLVLTPSERQIAETVVLPTEKRIWGTDIPGSGFARSFRGAIEKSAEGTVKSVLDMTGARNESSVAMDNLSQPENTRYAEVNNRSWVSRRLDGIGDLTGQVAMMALASKGLGAVLPKAGLLKTLTSFGAEDGLLSRIAVKGADKFLSGENMSLFVNSYLNSYDNYRQQATELMPGDTEAQDHYSKSMAFIEGLSEKIFNDTKVLKAFTGEVAPTVKDITKRFLSNEITAEVAKAELGAGIKKYAKAFAKDYVKSTAEESFEEGIVDVADGAAQSIYGGTPFDLAKTGQKALNTFLTTAINSPLVAGLAAHGAIRQQKQEYGFYKSALTSMASNPGEYLKSVDDLEVNKEITSSEANEKRKIIKSASKLLNELPETRTLPVPESKTGETQEVKFTPAETTSFLVHGLNQQILQDKIDKTTNPVVQQDLKKQLNRSQNIQKGIYDGSITVNDNLQEVAETPEQSEKLNIINPEAVPVQETVSPSVEQVAPDIIPIDNSQINTTQNESQKTSQAEGQRQEDVLTPSVESQVEADAQPFSQPEENLKLESENDIKHYRIDNTQNPSELAAIYASENDSESEVSKKASDKFQELTGHPLNQKNLEAAINTEFSKLPEQQKELLNNTYESERAVTDAYFNSLEGKENITPVTNTGEGENTSTNGSVGESNNETQPTGESETVNVKPTITETGKTLADKLRKLKSDRSKANANIFGVAVGVYDGVIETIATAIENGAKLADAIKSGIESLSESDRKNLNEKEFGQHIHDFSEDKKPRIKVTNTDEDAETVNAEKNTSGITHEATKETRTDFGLGDPYEKTTKTDKELNAEADRQIKEGYDVEKLINQIETGKVPSDVETTILKKYKANLEAQIEKNPTNENLNRLKRLIKASDSAGSEQGRALRSRQGLELRDDSLAAYFAREFDSNGNVDLSEEEKAKVIKEFNEIKAAEKAYQDKIAQLEADLKKALAEQTLKKEGSQPKKQKKTHEEFVKERKQILTDIQEKLRKARGETNIVIIPYAKELIAIAPDVAKLTRSLVQEGVIKLADVVSNLHTTLASSIPEITEQDVLDLIAGEYSEKKVSKNDLAKNLYELKTQAQLINRLTDLENGEVPTSEKKQKQQSKEIQDLRQKIKDHDLAQLTGIKSSTQKQIENLEQKIKSGDFSSIPKKEQIALDQEATDLREKAKQLQEEINDKKTVQELTGKLEKLQSGEEPKNDKEKKVRTDEIEGLKKQIRDHDLTKLSRVKSSTQKQIENLQSKLDRGEYENIKPEPLKLDNDAIALKDKLIKLRQQREERLIRQKYANRSKMEKFKDGLMEVINVPRSIMSSMDFSAPLRQGLIPTVSHPTYAAKAGVEMFKQAVSQKRFDRWFHDLRETPRYKLMEQAKLYVADPHDVRLAVKEESFMTNLAEKIPIIGSLVKGSERAYVSYLNKMRVDLFNRMADGFENEGMTWENNPELYKGAASFINNATGRGGIGVMESAAPILNSAFFSPRLIASRLNILGLSDAVSMGKGFYGSLPLKVRKQAIGDLSKFVGTGITVLALAYAASLGQKDDDKDKISVELDPRSSDFGKIKSGNTRWDIWGGFQQYIRVMAQLISGQTKSTTNGKIQSLTDGGMFGKTRGDIAFSFLRGKLAPVPSTAVDFLKGRTVTGDKVTVQDEVMSRLSPLILQDVGQAVSDNGIKSLFTVGLPSTFGVGVQNYGPRGFGKVDVKKDATYKFLYNKNVNLPETPLQGKMTEKEYKEYLPLHDKTFKESWDEVIRDGVMFDDEGKPTVNADKGFEIKDINKLSSEELSELMKSISGHATRAAKNELGINEAIKEREKAERDAHKKD